MRGYAFHGPTHYRDNSAGIRAWFALADRLTEKGCDVIHSLEPHAERIVIYPDVVSGNPTHSQRVVRWMLCYPDFFGVKTNPGPGELTFAWDPRFAPFADGGIPLQVDIIEHDLFFDSGEERCIEAAWIRAKANALNIPVRVPPGAVEINRQTIPRTRAQLAGLLRMTKMLYCFDPICHIIPEALACGCRVMLPEGEVTVADYPLRPHEEFDAMVDRFITLTQERYG